MDWWIDRVMLLVAIAFGAGAMRWWMEGAARRVERKIIKAELAKAMERQKEWRDWEEKTQNGAFIRVW